MKKAKLVLIASGSGTDASAIMDAYLAGFMPNVKLDSLVSTKEGAGCLEKAKKREIPYKTIVCQNGKDEAELKNFNQKLKKYLKSNKVDLVFLVGCIIKIFPVSGVDIYNIHPADPGKHGGYGMYGLLVHKRVIREVEDVISRGKKTLDRSFYTFPTVHRADLEYDSGDPILKGWVKIPEEIIFDYVYNREISLEEAAKILQKEVLQNEWMMLPAAVNMAAQRILSR